jgi:hypothetical protein
MIWESFNPIRQEQNPENQGADMLREVAPIIAILPVEQTHKIPSGKPFKEIRAVGIRPKDLPANDLTDWILVLGALFVMRNLVMVILSSSGLNGKVQLLEYIDRIIQRENI